MSVYLITGASGYIGSMCVDYIMHREKEARVIALVRNVEKAAGRFQEFGDRVTIVRADLTDRAVVAALEADCDEIIHCASVTKSAEMIAHPVEVTESIVNTAQNILELARRCQIRSMVYLSSMEVYGNIDCSDGHRVAEEELGDIALFQVRSCYPLGKRMAEQICFSYCKEYGVPVKIARLAQTFGRGVSAEESRVFAQFARAAGAGSDIVLHTQGNSMGNYCSIDDAVEGIFTILKQGADGEAYNVVNEANTMTIRQMAELVAEKIAGKKSRVICRIPKENCYGYAAETGLRLSGKKLEGLGWHPRKDLAQMYLDLMDALGE